MKRYTHIIEPSYELSDDVFSKLSEALGRLLKGEPIQYILGYAEFYGYRYKVNPSVLIPRPETEEMLSMVWDELEDGFHNAIDLCTGSGCIAWTLANICPDASVTAVDISPEALETARGQRTDCHKPDFILADVLSPSFDVPAEAFDVLVSNPPYVLEREKPLMRKNVLEHEPALALFVPDDDPLLFYRAIARFARKRLIPGGRGFLETNEAFADDVAALFPPDCFSFVEVRRDICGRNRFVFFRK